MKRKVVSLMLVSAMVAGMLAGCGSDSGSSKGGSSTETGSAAEASSSGETADDADDKSPITFEYFNADGKNGNWDNPVAKAITEATGVTLDVSYPVASQGDAKEDIALMKHLGIRAYRFSLNWARILPEGTGRVNEKAIAMYRDMILTMKENGITPYLTLFHWEFPQAR